MRLPASSRPGFYCAPHAAIRHAPRTPLSLSVSTIAVSRVVVVGFVSAVVAVVAGKSVVVGPAAVAAFPCFDRIAVFEAFAFAVPVPAAVAEVVAVAGKARSVEFDRCSRPHGPAQKPSLTKRKIQFCSSWLSSSKSVQIPYLFTLACNFRLRSGKSNQNQHTARECDLYTLSDNLPPITFLPPKDSAKLLASKHR